MSDPNEVTWRSQLIILGVVIATLIIFAAMVPPLLTPPCLLLAAVLFAVWLILVASALKSRHESSPDEPTTAPRAPRLFGSTPAMFVAALLAGEGILLLSHAFGWFSFNAAKGLSAVIAVEFLGVGLLLILFWFITSSIYGWRFQFSLRSLLALVFAVAVPFSWLAIERDKARKQSTAVEAIEAHGGIVIVQPIGPEPEWPWSVLGITRSFEVYGATYLNSTSGTDAVAAIKDLKSLRELTLHGRQFTDRNLADLATLPRLTRLDLDATAVTDKGLRHLKDLRRLVVLAIRSSPISGEGLAFVSHLNGLLALDLSGTNVTDSELEHLNDLTRLHRLSLVGTKVTAAGVQRLQKALPSCRIDWSPPMQPVPKGTSGRPATR